MIRDLLEQPLGGDLEADLCVIGAGAAGLTIARRFEGSGLRVCLIESGGLRPDPAVQDLYRGETVGDRYELDALRLRFFGGTTNHWTGVCGPLDPLDFEPRPWIDSPGWPFGPAELEPFYRRAHEILDLGPFEYDPALAAPGVALPAFDPARLVPGVTRFSPPTRFNTKYAGEIRDSAEIECLLNANVVGFDTGPGGSPVSDVRIATLAGGSGRVRARVFVLACGGIENPRILLNAGEPTGGLGNDNGLVGRFFADHIHHQEVGLVVAEGDWWRAFDPDREQPRTSRIVLRLGEEAQRREGLLNARVGLWPTETPDGVRGGARCLGIFGNCEQLPGANRVELGDERDALGQRRVRLHWTISEAERLTLERCVAIVGEELGRLRLGRVRVHQRLDRRRGLDTRLRRASHQMGTTRMSADPDLGVVNPDCRMHSVDNLFVAGSSVFPSCGQINPTLTIVALALRLGDHLAALLGVRTGAGSRENVER